MSTSFSDRLAGRDSQRSAFKSDVRPDSVDTTVIRAADSLFTYDDTYLYPRADRTLKGDVEGDVTGDVTGNADTATVADNGVPPGTVLPFAASAAPIGYLSCNGDAVSRTTYAALFAVIGETWGAGDSSTTFNVPNLAGVFLRGTGTGTINTRDKVGPSVGSYQEDQMQGHFHTYTSRQNAANNAGSVARGDGTNSPNTTDTAMGAPNTDGTNGTPRTGTETYPYNAGVLYIIKY